MGEKKKGLKMLFKVQMVGMTVCSLREEILTCCPVSKLPDLSEVYVNLHLLRKTEPNLHIISIKKAQTHHKGTFVLLWSECNIHRR